MATAGVASRAEALPPSALGDPKVRLLGVELHEALSRPFELRVELASEKATLDTAAAIGEPFGVKFTLPDGAVRHLHGRIESAGLLGSLRARWYRYELVVRPGFWFLRHTMKSRVFENMDAVAIVKDVLGKASALGVQVDAKVTKPCAARPYCVQYQESDFDFVSRLLEQEGICYFFRHSASAHAMVLADSASAHEPLVSSAKLGYRPGASKSAADADSVLEWRHRDHAGSAAFTLRDFDFERSTERLEATAKVKAAPGPKSLEVERWGEGYRFAGAAKGGAKKQPTDQATRFADALAEQRGAAARRIDGSTDALAMACGHTFEVEDLPAADQAGKYLVTDTRLEYRQGLGDGSRDDEGASYGCAFGALSSKLPFRPDRSVPWPRVHGPQTAIVIGAGEIDPDAYGRVKVRFHWGAAADGRDSCWTRVSHPWASKGFGFVALPRVGDEVVVSFLDGDPDQPLITGRVYNAQNMPPYELPARKTVSGLRTRSSEGGGADNFNELRFDDKKGDEHVWLQAEKIFHRLVKLDAFDVVQQDEHVKIGRDRTEEIGRDWQLAVAQHAVHKVGGDTQVDIAKDTLVNIGAHCNASIASDLLLAVAGKSQTDVAADWALNVGASGAATFAADLDLNAGGNIASSAASNVDVKAGANVAVEAGANLDAKAASNLHAEGGSQMALKAPTITIGADSMITLKAGPSTITLGPSGVTIDGPLVKINSGGGGSSAAAAAAAKEGKKAAKAQPRKPKAPAKPTEQKDPIKS